MNSTAGLEKDPEYLYSSARYDPALLEVSKNSQTEPPSEPSPYLLLPYHHDRLVNAAETFGWTTALDSFRGEGGAALMRKHMDRAVKEWEEDIKNEKEAPLKVRLLLHPDGELKIELSSTPPLLASNMFNNALATPQTLQTLASARNSSFNFLTVHLDPIPTPPSVLTSYKTALRDHYLASRARVGLGPGYSKPDEVILFNRSDEVMECSVSNIAFWREGAWVTPREEAGGLHGVMRRWLLEQGRWKEGIVKRGEVVKGEWVLLSNGLRGCFIGRIKE